MLIQFLTSLLTITKFSSVTQITASVADTPFFLCPRDVISGLFYPSFVPIFAFFLPVRHRRVPFLKHGWRCKNREIFVVPVSHDSEKFLYVISLDKSFVDAKHAYFSVERVRRNQKIARPAQRSRIYKIARKLKSKMVQHL